MINERLGRREFLYAAAAASALTLTGCGSGDDEQLNNEKLLDRALFTAPPLPEEDNVPVGRRDLSVDAFTKPEPDAYDPPITLSTVTSTRSSVRYPPGTSLEDNPYTRAYERKYGIKLDIQWAVDSTQLEQKTNLMIASGELPDYFLANAQQLDQLVNAGKVEDLTDVYQKHASDKLRGVLAESGRTALQSAAYGGRLMAIPFSGNPGEAAQVLFVRKDWLDALGLPEPKTMNDVADVAKAFTENDMSGNGNRDGYGLVLDTTLSMAAGFFNGYHAYKATWVTDAEGNIRYGSVQPEMKEALAKLQEMHKAGHIDPEFGVKDFTPGGKIEDDLVAERQGMFYYAGAGFWTNTLKAKKPDCDWICVPLPSVDDEPAKAQIVAPGVSGYWVVKKGYPHPEAVLKLIDFFIEAFYYVPSQDVLNAFVTYTPLDSPVYALNGAAAYRAYENIGHWKTITDLIDNGGSNPDIAKLRPVTTNIYKNIKRYLETGDPEYYYWPVGLYGPKATRAVQNMYRENDGFMPNQFYGVPTPAMGKRQALLDTMEDETFTRIIKGASIDEFDSFVDNWNGQGGSTITAEVESWHEKHK